MPVNDALEKKPRLRAIAALVPQGCRCLADIGTDHGYIPAELLRSGRVEMAVAADIGGNRHFHAARPQQFCRDIAVIRADISQTPAALRHQCGNRPQARLFFQSVIHRHISLHPAQ